MAKKSNTSFRLKRTSKSLLAPVEPIDRVSVQAETFRGISRLGSTLAESVKEFGKAKNAALLRKANFFQKRQTDAFHNTPADQRGSPDSFKKYVYSDSAKKDFKKAYEDRFGEELDDNDYDKLYEAYVDQTGGYTPDKKFFNDSYNEIKQSNRANFISRGKNPGIQFNYTALAKDIDDSGVTKNMSPSERSEYQRGIIAGAIADIIPEIDLKKSRNWKLVEESILKASGGGYITRDQGNQLRDVAAKAYATQVGQRQSRRNEASRASWLRQLGASDSRINPGTVEKIRKLGVGQRFGKVFNDAATGKADLKSSVRRMEEQINNEQSFTSEEKAGLVHTLRRKEREIYRRLVPQEKLVTTTTSTKTSDLDVARQSIKGGGTSTKIQTAPVRLTDSSERFLSRYYHKVAKEAAKDGVTRPQDFEAVVRDRLNIAPDNANNFLQMLHAPGSERFHGGIEELLDMRAQGRMKDEEFADKISKVAREMKDQLDYRGAASMLDFFGYEADPNKIGMAIRKDAPEPESTPTPTTRPTQPTQSSGKKEGGGVWDKVQTWWYNL